eukprot:scaffold178830_cov21-Tisochrysis_lutea.AAC.1
MNDLVTMICTRGGEQRAKYAARGALPGRAQFCWTAAGLLQAKNRLTAARSRERKKAILSELETKLQGFEAENARLQEMLAAMGKENKDLKQQLGQLCGPGGVSAAAAAAAAAGGSPGCADTDRSTKGPHSSSLPATSVKVLLALLLCMCLCKLTGEQLGL